MTEGQWDQEAFHHWKQQGLPTRVCRVFTAAGIKTMDQLQALGREGFLRQPYLGYKALKDVLPLTGWDDPTRPPLANIKTETLVNKLRRRGWTVKEPE